MHFSLYQTKLKSAKKVPFLQLKTFLSKEQNGIFFAIGSDVLIRAKKEPLKINDVFKLSIFESRFKFYWLTDANRLAPFVLFWIDWPISQETNMAEYMESNVTLIRNIIEDNKTYKHVIEILRQNFPEVTRGFSERNVRLFCAKYGIRQPNEYELDSFRIPWTR